MGRRGPPPKPTALKLVAGNPGGRELPAGEPIPPAGEPDPPEFLDERARDVWKQVVPRLARIGLARSIDGIPLGRYCVMIVSWTDAVNFVRKNGTTYAVRAPDEGKKPGRILAVREFPQVGEARKLNQALITIEREFGLTPAARTRINVQLEAKSKGDVNELKQAFFARGATQAPPRPAS